MVGPWKDGGPAAVVVAVVFLPEEDGPLLQMELHQAVPWWGETRRDHFDQDVNRS